MMSDNLILNNVTFESRRIFNDYGVGRMGSTRIRRDYLNELGRRCDIESSKGAIGPYPWIHTNHELS